MPLFLPDSMGNNAREHINDHPKTLELLQRPARRRDELRREDLDEFVACYRPDNRHDRKPTWSPANADGRFRAYDYEELASRDKASLDIFWLRDESLADSDNLPPPGVIAQESVQDLEAALEQFRLIAGGLNGHKK